MSLDLKLFLETTRAAGAALVSVGPGISGDDTLERAPFSVAIQIRVGAQHSLRRRPDAFRRKAVLEIMPARHLETEGGPCG